MVKTCIKKHDLVFHPEFGEGKVLDVYHANNFPIHVLFFEPLTSRTFMVDDPELRKNDKAVAAGKLSSNTTADELATYLGEVSYKAWYREMGWKDESLMPRFEETTIPIKKAWIASAKAIFDKIAYFESCTAELDAEDLKWAMAVKDSSNDGKRLPQRTG